MEFMPLLVILATVKKLIDFVRYAKAGDANAIVTQLVAWAAAFGLVALAAHTPWAASLVFGEVPLSKLGIAAQILVGVAVGSAASLTNDVIKAADNTQTAAVPRLLDPARTTGPARVSR